PICSAARAAPRAGSRARARCAAAPRAGCNDEISRDLRRLYYYGPMNRILRIGAALALIAACATPARADVTGFLGANTTPSNRHVPGGALGFGVLIIGVELEYAPTADDPTAGAPSLKTGMGNFMLQTPGEIHGLQPYFTTGGGFYHEALGSFSDTGFGL